MEDRLATLEGQVHALSDALTSLERRLAALEAAPARIAGEGDEAAPSRAVPATEASASAVAAARPEITVVTVMSLLGRTCLVLGGAYLLRALTDAGTLPRVGGTILGLLYAVAWLGLAYRLDAVGRRLVAPFYAVATALIAFPILWEATVRVKLLTPAQTALAMAGVTALAFAVAAARRIQPLAWIISFGGIVATLLLLAAVDAADVSLGFYLTFLGVSTLWIGYSLDWIWLRWPVAFVADCYVLLAAGAVVGPWHKGNPGAVMTLQLVMFAAYLVSIAARTLWRARDVVPFEVVQTVALLVVAFGGAVYVMQSTGAGATPLGLASLVFGAGSYGVAFAFVNRRAGRWKNFTFYASLAVVFTLAGVGLTVGATAQAAAWATLAIVAAWLGYRYSAIAVGSHAAVYLVAAAVSSGLLDIITNGFMGSAEHVWAGMPPAAWIVLASAAACAVIPATTREAAASRYLRIPKIVVVLLLLAGVGATLITYAAPLLAGRPGGTADPAVTAAVRSVVCAAAVLLLAFVGGRGLFPEGRWLMYIVLVVGGLKLLVEDFPQGRPATLVFSLAVYGAALILAPRWVRRAEGPGA
jgi:hypothetical protein